MRKRLPYNSELRTQHDGSPSFRHGNTAGRDRALINGVARISEQALGANLQRRNEIIEAGDMQMRISQGGQITWRCSRAGRARA